MSAPGSTHGRDPDVEPSRGGPDGGSKVKVVCFSGGRGSSLLSAELLANPAVDLTIAINGYDDGKSTGEVRRFLGDALGPSDYRKNASTVARESRSCSGALLDFLALRFPEGYDAARAAQALAHSDVTDASTDSFGASCRQLLLSLDERERQEVVNRLELFWSELERSARGFSFSDCSVGNLVFAGSYLREQRRFNHAVSDYCQLLGLPPQLIQNVTDGENAHLVAITGDGRLLATEAEIVDSVHHHQIEDIFLVDRPLSDEEIERIDGRAAALELVAARAKSVTPNAALLARIDEADIIIYAPGTQHSSLLPSYLTPGVGSAIASNMTAVKVLVTNIREDAELLDTSAVDITSKALYYLRQKDQLPIPAPFLITHYLLNDPAHDDEDQPYVPLGRLQLFDDPRLVRIANFEQAESGRHDASKILTPFIRTYLERDTRLRIAIILLDATSLDKVCQTILESSRAGLHELPVEATFLFATAAQLSHEMRERLPFSIENMHRPEVEAADSLLQSFRAGSYDAAVLFESSGMYRGEDITNLVALFATGSLDAAWGSRRLSVSDIRQSYHLRYRKHPLIGAVSYAGSYLLSLIFLGLYGRYISDVLSGARAIRTRHLLSDSLRLDDKTLNQRLLCRILRERGEIFETPVRFFSMSPEKAHRTTWWDGLRSIGVILRLRFGSGS